MSSFFQTNPLCAEKLYAKVIEYSINDNLNQKSIILDLFCGTGTIAQLIAIKQKKQSVIGVDIVQSSIENVTFPELNKCKNQRASFSGIK